MKVGCSKLLLKLDSVLTQQNKGGTEVKSIHLLSETTLDFIFDRQNGRKTVKKCFFLLAEMRAFVFYRRCSVLMTAGIEVS